MIFLDKLINHKSLLVCETNVFFQGSNIMLRINRLLFISTDLKEVVAIVFQRSLLALVLEDLLILPVKIFVETKVLITSSFT